MAFFHRSSSFQLTAERLSAENPIAWAQMVAGFRYLEEYREAAVAPDVRWGIALSRFGKFSGEVRWPFPEDQADHPNSAFRTLFVVATDYSWAVLTILGNKATHVSGSNAWYDEFVPISDQIAVGASKQLSLKNFPPEVKM